MATKVTAWKGDDGRLYHSEDDARRAEAIRDAKTIWLSMSGQDSGEVSAFECVRLAILLSFIRGFSIDEMVSQVRSELDL